MCQTESIDHYKSQPDRRSTNLQVFDLHKSAILSDRCLRDASKMNILVHGGAWWDARRRGRESNLFHQIT